MSTVITKHFALPEICEAEVLRYASVKTKSAEISDLMSSCISEAAGVTDPKLCYIELDLSSSGDELCFGAFSLTSRDLAKCLSGCKKALIFAATIGIGLDRLIMKYSRLSPSRALILQAIGAERIETLCDEFEKELSKEFVTRPRFSPGYGDLSLDVQRDIFKILDAPRRIGISLNESLSMSPTKSVTAIIGIKNEIY